MVIAINTKALLPGKMEGYGYDIEEIEITQSKSRPMSEFIDALKSAANRLTNPLLFSLLCAFSIYNWEVVVALLWYDPDEIHREGYTNKIYPFIPRYEILELSSCTFKFRHWNYPLALNLSETRTIDPRKIRLLI